MSLSQRREHKPVPGQTSKGITLCTECGERLRFIAGHTSYRHESGDDEVQGHWRHWRRWHRAYYP